MLGLKLNHVSKRDHWWQFDARPSGTIMRQVKLHASHGAACVYCYHPWVHYRAGQVGQSHGKYGDCRGKQRSALELLIIILSNKIRLMYYARGPACSLFCCDWKEADFIQIPHNWFTVNGTIISSDCRIGLWLQISHNLSGPGLVRKRLKYWLQN